MSNNTGVWDISSSHKNKYVVENMYRNMTATYIPTSPQQFTWI